MFLPHGSADFLCEGRLLAQGGKAQQCWVWRPCQESRVLPPSWIHMAAIRHHHPNSQPELGIQWWWTNPTWWTKQKQCNNHWNKQGLLHNSLTAVYSKHNHVESIMIYHSQQNNIDGQYNVEKKKNILQASFSKSALERDKTCWPAELWSQMKTLVCILNTALSLSAFPPQKNISQQFKVISFKQKPKLLDSYSAEIST